MTSLDEVVVIGYGTTTRRRSVGAVDQVKSEVLETRSVANLLTSSMRHPKIVLK